MKKLLVLILIVGLAILMTQMRPEKKAHKEAMMKAVSEKSPRAGQLSFDARMGCGYGACMGCTRKTVDGPKRVCKDGPVFDKEAIVWED